MKRKIIRNLLKKLKLSIWKKKKVSLKNLQFSKNNLMKKKFKFYNF